MQIKELLKDWQVLLYIGLAIFSIVYLIYSLVSTHVVVLSSKILPNGSTVYYYKYYDGSSCKVKTVQDFYRCIRNNTENIVVTDQGSIEVSPNETILLYKTKVMQESNIKLGIDLAGGIRVILKPKENITYQEAVIAASVIEKRLNAYGLKSIDIKVARDTEGGIFLIVELPQSEQNLIKLIQKEGKFEAKIGNVTVFTGRDIVAVHTYPPEGGVGDCSRTQGGWICRFHFTVYLTKEAAQRFAEATKDIPIELSAGQAYLKLPLDLYVDGKKVDSLRIAADLKGKAVDKAMITGPGFGKTREQAIEDASKKMKELATIISYGSLPTTFEVVRVEKIPPVVGEKILKSVLIGGLIAFLAVSGLIFMVYRRLKVALLLISNMILELIMTIVIGILLGQTFDLPAIAGVLIAIGTGVDDQIIAIEEILKGKKELKLEKKVWKILFIVVSSFITILFAMFPLLFAGLGLFRGFAIMTLIGAFIGAFITRPAFVKIAEKIL